MTAQTVSLRVLKGAPLSVLFALSADTSIAGTEIVVVTGYGIDTVKSALVVLEHLGLAVQVGQSWIGTPRAVAARENLVLLGKAGISNLDQPVDNSMLTEKISPRLINYAADGNIDSEKIIQHHSFNAPAPEKKLLPVDKQRLEAVLITAGVYPDIAKSYARRVAEGKKVTLDLRLALGWLAFATRNGGSLGGVIVKKIKNEEIPADEFLPPAHYDFDQALAWAKGERDVIEPDCETISSDKSNTINDNSLMRRNLIRALKSVEISPSECNSLADEILGRSDQCEMDRQTDLLPFTSLDVLALIAYGREKRNIANLAGFVITEIRKGNQPPDRYRAPTAEIEKAIQWTSASSYERDVLANQWATAWRWLCISCKQAYSGPEALYLNQQACNSCGGWLIRGDLEEIKSG